MHPEQYPGMHPELLPGYASVLPPPGEQVDDLPPGEEIEDVPPGTEEPLSIPPPDLQTIIDKMASYVARIGTCYNHFKRL